MGDRFYFEGARFRALKVTNMRFKRAVWLETLGETLSNEEFELVAAQVFVNKSRSGFMDGSTFVT